MKRSPNGKPLIGVEPSIPLLASSPEAQMPGVKVTDFQVISFFDEHAKRMDGASGSEVILIYALGEDGVVREFANGKWTPFPI